MIPLTTPSWIMKRPWSDLANRFIRSLPRNYDRMIWIDTIPVRIYGTEKGPILLYFHGGGFFLEEMDYMDWILKTYARIGDCQVWSIQYRTKAFPDPFEDAIAALRFVHDHFPLTPIMVGGDSAGGCIAAGLCIWAREHSIPIAKQMLIYPVLSEKMESGSMNKKTFYPMWNPKANAAMWKRYVDHYEGKWTTYRSPYEYEDLHDLPLTYIEVEENDCLKDEGIGYAYRLIEAKNVVLLKNHDHLFHGFELFKNKRVEQIVIDRARFLKTNKG